MKIVARVGGQVGEEEVVLRSKIEHQVEVVKLSLSSKEVSQVILQLKLKD